MSKLDIEAVKHVALLARLELSEEEIEHFARDLNTILDYVAKLNELDTSGVPPTSHSLALSNVFREDIVRESLPAEAALANAPEAEDGCFKVPAVIQEQ
ncbi:MAG: Asp-tRNA(Asn)/Glu-tRNA(Gln) amidotransferase subunit GatC [Candidatus Hydrogenedentota bacterium]|jgi:aspartyl-tRNA(Asn)/glutamyl-tRNA(Gln) amidotransferase subunit C|uniref:Aspartyl/glutamyl-tRNA(Asn/Gln) amidotransferase subunit C n=1 Tax=Sumerlaea chitinivorans TaxID=2250252 RepID=A0A2Z4Y680_SUMC1|nr:Aspartyl-tRNA(Asn) amidotransferase subunit C [Candidatus Sumerlaea chitinivorans]MCX7964748.1 Asp-tRNA(Asn)/Glu-tRNA(Gln) amidotransferase subunit GatC [Candidatus Sumerlaea chitinivorans]RMH29663.1 MAG: Asp-tRNA(Asn)/Glu-tRNA(Gln) amidotransferase subunit GatC [Candidatus Hydrogenedentota bacterium]GIX44012.1 MAG: aspartyl/glutamyl-tRNA(Asn/Gln) amidotransferase subunit C [Candidatus Sumerlaea sp.]